MASSVPRADVFTGVEWFRESDIATSSADLSKRRRSLTGTEPPRQHAIQQMEMHHGAGGKEEPVAVHNEEAMQME